MREVRSGLVPFRSAPEAAESVEAEGLELYDAESTVSQVNARFGGGPTLLVTQRERVQSLCVAYRIANRMSDEPLRFLRDALQRQDFDLFTWSAWKEPADRANSPDVGDEISSESNFETSVRIAEAEWLAQKVDAPVRLSLTIPDDNREVSIDAPSGVLVLHPGSVSMKLAFKFKKPVGFALAFFRNQGVMASQLAANIHRSLRETVRSQPGIVPLQEVTELKPDELRNKSALVIFIHGLISTDLGLFDALIKRLQLALPRAQLVGYPHNTFASIETNAVTLADWVEKVAGPELPVMFVCHSRGGLVARATAVELRERRISWGARLRGCVTFGTPHEGAAFAEVAEDFYPTFASLATLSGSRNVLSAIDVLTYFGSGGRFEGIEDLRPLDGAGSTRERFLKTLREREGRHGRIDLLAFGGKVDLSGRAAKLVRRLLAGVESDQVVELSSTTPKLFDQKSCVTTACNHFDYFKDEHRNWPHFSRVLRYMTVALGMGGAETMAG